MSPTPSPKKALHELRDAVEDCETTTEDPTGEPTEEPGDPG